MLKAAETDKPGAIRRLLHDAESRDTDDSHYIIGEDDEVKLHRAVLCAEHLKLGPVPPRLVLLSQQGCSPGLCRSVHTVKRQALATVCSVAANCKCSGPWTTASIAGSNRQVCTAGQAMAEGIASAGPCMAATFAGQHCASRSTGCCSSIGHAACFRQLYNVPITMLAIACIFTQ